MKNILLIIGLLFPITNTFAHDEGHGPKLTDAGKYGGVVSPVIDAKEISLGNKASVVYKAELVRSEDRVVKVYFYDKEMKPLDTSKFEKSAKAILEIEKKKKVTKTPFDLILNEGFLTGQFPKPPHKPFNIDVTLKEAGRALLVAFDGLD